MNIQNVVLLSRCRNVFALFSHASESKLRAVIDIGDIVAKVRQFLPNLWQEARGNVIRKQYDGLKSRIDAADIPAKSACFALIRKFEPFRVSYANASSADRKRILQVASKTARQWFDAGDWPRAFGLAIVMFNLETGHLPGDGAAVVKAATDALISEANAYSEVQDPQAVAEEL